MLPGATSHQAVAGSVGVTGVEGDRGPRAKQVASILQIVPALPLAGELEHDITIQRMGHQVTAHRQLGVVPALAFSAIGFPRTPVYRPAAGIIPMVLIHASAKAGQRVIGFDAPVRERQVETAWFDTGGGSPARDFRDLLKHIDPGVAIGRHRIGKFLHAHAISCVADEQRDRPSTAVAS